MKVLMNNVRDNNIMKLNVNSELNRGNVQAVTILLKWDKDKQMFTNYCHFFIYFLDVIITSTSLITQFETRKTVLKLFINHPSSAYTVLP